MNPPVDITHLGGEHCVTGSCHLLRWKDLSLLVDCGTAQGHDPLLPMEQWPINPAEIDYLFLTHAHIDHIGRVPELVTHGFAGEILCTEATRALLQPMLTDAMGFSGLNHNTADRLLKTIDELSWGFEYDKTFTLKKGVTFTFRRAGHILGSAFILFSFPVTATSSYRVIFSGDLGSRNTPILPDPDPPDSCDLLVLESTYGNRLHEGRDHRLQRLGEKLEHALADGGKIYIPAFALGRTQEILYELDRLFTDPHLQKEFPTLNSTPRIPVFVDSPLGLKITSIYSSLQTFWDKESRALQAAGDHPFDFERLFGVSGYRDHQALLNLNGPAIIIAGSGMCTGGRIVDHLEEGLKKTENDFFFIGYQGVHYAFVRKYFLA